MTFWRDLTVGVVVDVFQTAVLVYIIIRFERVIHVASASLQEVLEGIRRNAERIDAIDKRQADLETAWRKRPPAGS
jgi:hypothetical protein